MWLDLQKPTKMSHFVSRVIPFWNIEVFCAALQPCQICCISRAILSQVLFSKFCPKVFTAGFRDSFYNPHKIMDVVYKEVGGWLIRRWVFPTIRVQTVVMRSQWVTEMYTIHRIEQDGHWQQFGIHLILISALQAL